MLAYFDTAGLSNGGTEAINGLIDKARRLTHGYRNITNYRLRMLLAAGGQSPPTAEPHDHAQIRRARAIAWSRRQTRPAPFACF